MKRGFTLIETLVYLAIFSMVIGGVVSATYLLLQSSGKVQTNAMMLQEEQFLMTTIERYIGAATSISAPATAGVPGTTLTMGSDSFTYSSPHVLLNSSPLNSTNVRVTAISFTRTASPVGITTEITVEANTPNGQVVTYSASTTKYLRK